MASNRQPNPQRKTTADSVDFFQSLSSERSRAPRRPPTSRKGSLASESSANGHYYRGPDPSLQLVELNEEDETLSYTTSPPMSPPAPSIRSNGAPSVKSNKIRPPPLPMNNLAGTLASMEAHDDVPPPSPSLARWANLRQKVVTHDTPFSPPSTPPTAGSAKSPPPPKPSRLGRLGFRSVVERVVTEAASTGDSHRSQFAEEVRRACWMARFGDTQPHRREGSVSSTSLPSTNYAPRPSISQPSSKGKRPLSIIVGMPTLKPLHEALLRFAPPAGVRASPANPAVATGLPHEDEVLAVLLLPFVSDDPAKQLEESRWAAVEIFEIAVRVWKSGSLETELARWLWCCRAAHIPPSPLSSRVLSVLASQLFSSAVPWPLRTPAALSTLLSSLFLLLPSYSSYVSLSSDSSALQQLQDIIARVVKGDCGELDASDVGLEYGTPMGRKDHPEDVRREVVSEAAMRCFQVGPELSRRWMLGSVVEDYWPTFDPQSTTSLPPLRATVIARKLSVFARSALDILRSSATVPTPRSTGYTSDDDGMTGVNGLYDPQYEAPRPMEPASRTSELDARAIIRLLTTRALVELPLLPRDKAVVCQSLIIVLTLELMCTVGTVCRDAANLLAVWIDDTGGWREGLESGLKDLIENEPWDTLGRILVAAHRELRNEPRKVFIALVLPQVFARLVSSPPARPPNCPMVTEFLTLASTSFPQQFYKPLFTLAASSKEPTIVSQLRIVTAIAVYLPHFWTGDVTSSAAAAEMFSVALMSDAGGNPGGKGKGKDDELRWGKTRLGQCVLTLELIAKVKELSKAKKDPTSPPDTTMSSEVRFFTALESRLGVLLDTKEQHVLFPFSQRLLLTVLFLEIRLFTQSLKPAHWLPRIVTWTLSAHPQATVRAGVSRTVHDPFTDHTQRNQGELNIESEVLDEVNTVLAAVGGIYRACWDPTADSSYTQQIHHHRRSSTAITLSQLNANEVVAVAGEGTAESLESRSTMLLALPARLITACLAVLVAVCGLLDAEDHGQLGILLWDVYLDDPDPHVVAPSCFLLMQSTERASDALVNLIKDDLLSENKAMQLRSINRLSILFGRRFQLLSQHYITDRVHRRPFKLAGTRHALSFVATDVGASHYIPDWEPDAETLNFATALPPEVRRRLLELGWDQENKPVEKKAEIAPMSLMPVQQLDHPDDIQAAAMTVTVAEEKVGDRSSAFGGRSGLLRRKSSSASHLAGGKRRAIFVPPLVSTLATMASLVLDKDAKVSSAARHLMMVIMRDEPAMICRPVMESLSALDEPLTAFTNLRALLHVQSALPSFLIHHVFNNLAGLIKSLSRDMTKDPLVSQIVFANALPVLANLVSQLSNMSIRELRKAKLDPLLLPSGSLWFSGSTPAFPMLPRGMPNLGDDQAALLAPFVGITMVRTAQNHLLLNILQRDPREMNSVRKTLAHITLPNLDPTAKTDDQKTMEFADFVPRKSQARPWTPLEASLRRFSLALARSHLLLVAEVFKCLSRQTSDQVEIARLLEGVNRIMLRHGDDLGIVTHSLIVYMFATTRLRRFFASTAGFTLIVPTLLRIYCQAEGHDGIRRAIEYAVHRIYSLHDENFLFQLLDVSSHMIIHPLLSSPEDQEWFASNVFQLLSSFSMANRGDETDAAGIHNVNRHFEMDAIRLMTDAKPDVILRPLNGEGGEHESLSSLLDKFEGKHFPPEDVVRLFVTVIAHDSAILRAQQFLTLLRCLTPHLHDASMTARQLLRDGIDALGSALFSKAGVQRARVPEAAQIKPTSEKSAEVFVKETLEFFLNKVSSPSDYLVMRREYFLLIVAYTKAGGVLSIGPMNRTLDLLKVMLKESARSIADPASKFLGEFTHNMLLKDATPTVKQAIVVLREIAPLLRAYGDVLDFTVVLNSIASLAQNPSFANDRTFARMVVSHFCRPALTTCDLAASERLLHSLPSRGAVVRLVNCAVSLVGTDVIGEIESKAPSPAFLKEVVLPLCLVLRTNAELTSTNQAADSWIRQTHSRVWVRLLAYAMSACEGISASTDAENSPKTTTRSEVAIFFTAFQIIKVIVIRAGDELSETFPGVWTRLAGFLQPLLRGGDGRFVVQAPDHDISPLNSRPSSPTPIDKTWSLPSDVRKPHASSSHPRAVDYLLWGILELACVHRTPLSLQLRLWMQDKATSLESEFSTQHHRGFGMSPLDNRRLSFSPFTKARIRSGYSSGAPSPEGSPLLTPRNGRRSGPMSVYSSPTRLSAAVPYNRFPAASPGAYTGPRILHLGPTTQPEIPLSSGERHIQTMLMGVRISSPELVRQARLRVATVHTFMGYSWPVEDLPELPPIRTWTKLQALKYVMEETELIEKEFEECFSVPIGGPPAVFERIVLS